MPSTPSSSPRLLQQVLQALTHTYGPRPWQCWGRGLDVLIGTILSQNTSAANSDAGYKRLRRRFRSWNQVADAPVEEVEKCIRICGLSRLKAPRIQSILRQIRQERRKLDLEFLRDWPADDAYRYLLQFKGIGPKTANCVLLFAFGMPLFPVDTHIHRIAQRLGIIGPEVDADTAHEILTPLIRPEDRYPLHVLLIAHGRKTCRAQRPLCEECCLSAICPAANCGGTGEVSVFLGHDAPPL